jgi:hypothetical protein
MDTEVYIAFFDELEKIGVAKGLTPPKPIVPNVRKLQKTMLKTPKIQPQYIPQRAVPLPAPQGQTSTLQPIVNVGQ